MKEKIIKLITENSKAYWDEYPDEIPKVTEDQRQFMNKIDSDTADEIIQLFDSE